MNSYISFRNFWTKSRSVDQSLAAAFDVDVIGGLSRLAGSARGNSDVGGLASGQGRSSPLDDRRSSTSGSTGRLAEDTLAYTVHGSDTLTSVAARFDTTPSELVSLNKLHSRLIFPGQVLQVPRKDAAAHAIETAALKPLNVSVSSSNEALSDVGAQFSPTITTDKSNEHAFLDSLRPPGSPLVKMTDLSFNDGGESGCGDEADAKSGAVTAMDVTSLDVELERVKDRSAYEKFLKINVRHITDGQGVVAGVLLVTPNTVMFDPNVSDPLVIEHGAEAYGVIAPVELVVNAALYPDIAHMRVADSKVTEQPAADPIYFPTNCPLHRKYALLKDKELKEKQLDQQDHHDPNDHPGEQLEAEEHQQDPSAPLLAVAVDVQLPSSDADEAGEKPDQAPEEKSHTDSSATAAANKTPEKSMPQLQPHSDDSHVNPSDAGAAGGAAQSIIPDADAPKLSVGNSSLGIGSIPSPSITKTPSGEGDDAFFPEEFNVSYDDDKSGVESAITDAMQDEGEFRNRHSSAGSSSGASGSSAAYSGLSRTSRSFRGTRHPQMESANVPMATGRPQSGSPAPLSPAPLSSSPESRGHRMLKRLSYPLVWMGESFSAESKEASPVLKTDDPNAESVFSKVFSRSDMSLNSSFPTSNANDGPVSAKYGFGQRRMSTENSLIKLDGRLVPNMFKGKETTSVPSGAGPKLGYRSMVSVDDVPELFASLDKLIPKPAQPCEAPPLYLRLRMGKPLNRKTPMTTPIMSYGKKKMKPEYWFSIPRDKADSLCRFFLLWSPDVYGEVTDAEVETRGFQILTEDLEWEEPSGSAQTIHCPSKQPLKKIKIKKNNRGSKDDDIDDDEEETLGGVTAELAKESWERAKAPYVRLFTILKSQATLFESDQDEIVSLNEEVRRALYGQSLSTLDLENYLPELIGPTEILTDEYRKQLSKHLPARIEGYPWTLVFSTSQNGFSLSSLYRKMTSIESPILLIIEDTLGNVFGAVTSCELRMSESFYGTGESFLFLMNPSLTVHSWSGENSYFIQGNNESLAFGAGDGRFGLWLDGDLNHGRSQTCKTFGNDPLSPQEDFWVKTLECWAFM